VVEISKLMPSLVGLSKPGRFLLGRDALVCKRGDEPEAECVVILLSDILILTTNTANDDPTTWVHLLEHCVALEAPNQTLEVFDSSSNMHVNLKMSSADSLQQWLRWLMFACTVTKSKFRGSTHDRKKMTLRNTMAHGDTFEKL
jgi:hypothetical protein